MAVLGSLTYWSETVCVGAHYYKVMFLFLFVLSCSDVELCEYVGMNRRIPRGIRSVIVYDSVFHVCILFVQSTQLFIV